MPLLHVSKETIGRFAGPIAFVLLYFVFPPKGLSPEAVSVLAATAWIAIWWITEAMPIAATALLPVVLFPMSGGPDLKDTLSGYSHPYIFLFIGGFTLAIALEKWNLHQRIALHIIKYVGSSPRRIVLGFMIATGFLSMWISNTATTVMMLPIGTALVAQINTGEKLGSFGKALMLGIAYSASIGGIATLIGTPPNLILAGVLEKTYGYEISFMSWFKIGLPFAVVMLFICWIYLTQYAYKLPTKPVQSGVDEIKKRIAELAKMSTEEKLVIGVFSITALAWVTRSFLLQPIFPRINDTIIAIASALLLFLLPAPRSGGRLLHWEDAVKLPWGVLLLFGGGISIANAFDQTGLASWIGEQFQSMEGTSILLLIVVLIATVNFLTEITSNLATTAVILPILAPLAIVMDMHPFVLMSATAMAASCAFMLPVATPPNALVFGSGYFKISDMMRAGIWLNLISIGILVIFAYILIPLIWGVELTPFPANLK